MSAQFTFFENQTANGTSPVYNVQDGGERIVKYTGDFDGATISLQLDFGDGLYAPIAGAEYTAAGAETLKYLKPGLRIRVVLTNVGAATNITVKIL